jgi:hypothetical protein
MTASEIIAKFGSIAELGRVLDVPMTTVSSWGLIPNDNQIPTGWRRTRESKRPSDTSHSTPWGDVVELPTEARISHHVRERSE